MPARMIRDGLLESEAVLSLPAEGRWLYVSILLSADDVGLFEATPFRLARKADVRRELADRLLAMLVDVDLVRLYQHEGKQYGFIPRFAQRLQIKRARCPLPPLALLEGDTDALNKIKHLTSNPTVDHRYVPVTHGNPPPEPEPEPEERQKDTPAPRAAQDPQPPAAAGKRSRSNSELQILLSDGIPEQHALDWLKIRKVKKLPLTQTAWDRIKADAKKAGITPAAAVQASVENGWAGWKATWAAQTDRFGKPIPEPADGAAEAAKTKAYLDSYKQTPAEKAASEEARRKVMAAIGKIGRIPS